jgi:hypothetical protein
MSIHQRTPPPITAFSNAIGSPGASVSDLGSKFGHGQVVAGVDGEIRTARALANHCKPGGPTVLHDLILPMSNIKANIDHIIISGNDVRILDSKTWTPGFYWTFLGRTRKGMTRIEHADKKTMAMATIAINKLLSKTGVRFVMKRPVLVVWSSNTKKQMSLRFYRPFGAKATTGRSLTNRTRHFAGTQPANQELVAALVPLVISLRNRDQKAPTATRPTPTVIPTATFSPEPEFFPEPMVESVPDFLPEPIEQAAPDFSSVPTKTVYASDDF